MNTFKTIILCLLFFNLSLFAKDVESLEVDELESYIQKNIIIIDIRSEKEWKKTGIIPSSYRLPYSQNFKNKNQERWLYTLVRLIKEKNKAFVLISKDGQEAKDLSIKLYNEKKFSHIMYLEGGINSWIDANRRVINY